MTAKYATSPMVTFGRGKESEAVISGRQIRAARSLLGWNQADLAEKAGISRPALYKIETATTDPHASTLRRIEEVFEEAGVELIPATNGHGEGVRMMKP